MEIMQAKSKKKKFLNKNNLWDLWDNIKWTNICIIVSQKEKTDRRSKMYLRKLWLKNSKTCKRKQISKYKKHRESQTR